jgi:cytochrome c-type biogenesis protein CcmH/NrfG
MLRFFWLTMIVVGAWSAIRIVRILARRLEGDRGRGAAAENELAALRERVEELESQQARLLELEERVDFAERLLAWQRDGAALPGGRGRP